MTAIATLQRFASDGLVYRAFDHAVVAAMGLVVAVPLWHTEGCLKELPEYRATVFIHPESGLRLASASDYIHKTDKANQ